MENNNQTLQESGVKAPVKEYNTKRLVRLTTITAILCFMSILALIMLYLSLSDIAKGGQDLKLEWFVVGLSFVILAVFIIVVMITIAFLLPMPGFFGKKKK
ncbi:MAG: hypothetical protein WBJ37_13470 [Bacteroidales bacterium]